MKKSEGFRSDLLQCRILRFFHSYQTHDTTLVIPDGHRTSMDGSIAFVKQFDPDVKLIRVESGDSPCRYVRDRKGNWRFARGLK
jgi:hypothetical protein